MAEITGETKQTVVVTCGECGAELETTTHRGQWVRDHMNHPQIEVRACQECVDQQTDNYTVDREGMPISLRQKLWIKSSNMPITSGHVTMIACGKTAAEDWVTLDQGPKRLSHSGQARLFSATPEAAEAANKLRTRDDPKMGPPDPPRPTHRIDVA